MVIILSRGKAGTEDSNFDVSKNKKLFSTANEKYKN